MAAGAATTAREWRGVSVVEGGAGTPADRTATSGVAGPAVAPGPAGGSARPAGAPARASASVAPAHVRLAWRARRAAFGTLLSSSSGAAACLALLRGRR